MYCSNCGAQIADVAAFCPDCGAQWNGTAFVPRAEQSAEEQQPDSAYRQQDSAYQQPAQQAYTMRPAFADTPAGLDRSTFINEHAKNAKSCKTAAIFGYACAGITLVFSIIQGFSAWILIDLALIVGLCVPIQIKKSRVCAVLFMAYALFSCISSSISMGTLAGWWILVAAILALTGTFGCEKEWKSYQAAQSDQSTPGAAG